MIEKLDFQIAFGAVSHFGRNLYTTNPPAITELIANSWDAYATESIIIQKENSMIIIDNGIGMTDDEFQNRYARSGFKKDLNVRNPNNFPIRPYMGKKGIGKFSAFSLSEKYDLYTKSSEDTQWKKISLSHDIISTREATVEIAIERLDEIDHLTQEYLFTFNHNTGTILVLRDLKRKTNSSTFESLGKMISRRFSSATLLNGHEFKIIIKDKEIDLKSHFYYENVENVYFFNKNISDVKLLFNHLSEEKIFDKSSLVNNTSIKGWIASVDKPSQLKIDETRISGVSVYINGKLADENILKFTIDDRIPASYIIGEVDADYLDQYQEDVVLSSREGLNQEFTVINDLKDEIKRVRDQLISDWNNLRSRRVIEKQDYLLDILAVEKNRTHYNLLDEKSKQLFSKISQKLFDRPNKDVDKEKINRQLFAPAIFQMVNDQRIKEYGAMDSQSSEDLMHIVSDMLNITEISHAIRLRASLLNRIEVVKELQKFMVDGEIEKVFENHLAKHPWLIEPFWDVTLNQINSQKYVKINDNNEVSKGYLDLIISVSDSKFPIIVEVKREKSSNYSKPSVEEIINQVDKYRGSIIAEYNKQYRTHYEYDNVPAYFICGKASYVKLTQDDLKKLDKNNINLRTYDNLVNQALKTYEMYKEEI